MNQSEALAKVYEAFSSEKRPAFIPACSCCVSEDEVKKLLSTPLRELSPQDLSSYASSVFLTSGSEADFRYYLPRILEISLTDQSWWPDREIVLRSLPLAEWSKWTQHEKDSLQALFRAAFDSSISEPNGTDDIDSWICDLAKAGVDLSPYLQRLEAPSAIQALVCFYEWNAESLQKGKLSNAFWEGEAAIDVVVKWFESKPVQAVIWKHYGL